ncbi:site-specific integrase [Methylobacterium sp. UNC300MFChir4.1]|uniref:tyrosine-type recombinase/integrase n=1 Tax=Methylobacterium sp. UNC300MFChir4.1 TaxID=1502747 RepID=UPI000C21010F|nr:site-specific integrase [Methylobacterium sp. UNC300MFChir4.1]
MQLTDQSVLALTRPKGRPQLYVFDDEVPGFGARIGARTRVWIIQYRNLAGQTKRETIGKVGLLSAADARKAGAEMLTRARLALEPRAECKEASAVVTIGSLIPGYLAERAEQLSESYLNDLKRYLEVRLEPLHPRPLQELTRAEVKAWLLTVRGISAANQARAALSKFYSWAIASGLAEKNPVAGTEKRGRQVRRDRVLKGDELKAVWCACAGNDDFSLIVRLLILLGQRRDEIARMRWEEIDFVDATWSLPGERTKNGLPHEVPLPPLALKILRQRDDRRLSGRRHVFGVWDNNGFSGFSKAKAALDERCPFATPWRLHDLRRTCATQLARMRVPPYVIEAVLNHVSGTKAGVAGIYNRHLYDVEKREALELWARYIEGFDEAPTS